MSVDLKPIEFVNAYRVDQVEDAVRHIKHAATLGLPELMFYEPTQGRCIIVGGAPSAKDHIAEIKALAADPSNAVFALNYTHNWLLENGVVPRGCLLFEIDADPTRILEKPHPDVMYFVCSLCHPGTFSGLEGSHITVWHAATDENKVAAVHEAFGPNAILVTGGATTFLRTIGLAIVLGFRKFDIFGCDSSFPQNATSTHFEGYPAETKPDVDGFEIEARCDRTGDAKRFRTVGYLCEQAEHFRLFCQANKPAIADMRVHGDGLLRFIHEHDFPQFYR